MNAKNNEKGAKNAPQKQNFVQKNHFPFLVIPSFQNFFVDLFANVNYPPTAKPMGRASGFIDSSNDNASSRFCFMSDCVP